MVQRPPSTVKDLLKFLMGPDPFNCVRYFSSEMEQSLSDLLRAKSFDIVQIEFSLMWGYARIFGNMPVVLNTQNIEYQNIRQLKDAAGNPLKKLLYLLEEKKLKKREQEAWRQCALCFAVSEKEREVMVLHVNSDKVFTIPNGVDLERFKFLPHGGTGKRLLFIGGMDYAPNLDSAEFFLKEIFPVIRSKAAI